MKKLKIPWRQKMAPFLLICLLTTCQWSASPVYAEIAHIEGGVQGDPTLKAGTYEFQEMTFISGEPILLSGTLVVPTPPAATATTYKLVYTYELSNSAKSATLSRKTTYDVTKTKNTSVNQTTYKYVVSKLDESYKIGEATYTLGSQIINKSTLEDNTPAVDYFSGNIYSRRVFYKNGDARTNSGKVTIETHSTADVGYKHKWGNSETQVIEYKLSGEIPVAASGTTAATVSLWSGSVQLNMSSQEKKQFEYVKTDPQTISFRGNYIEKTRQENLLKYTYNLPTLSGATIDDKKRVKDSKSIKRDFITSSKSLITPKLRDIQGHWAEKSIYLTTSLELFNANTSYFAPNTNVTRKDFFKGITRVVEDIKSLTPEEIIKRNRTAATAVVPYPDIDPKDPDIAFYEFIKESNIAIGENEDFLPLRPVTRAEMITVMINTLGLGSMAPQPPYKTMYKDNADIPFWAKDAIYMANEIGLVSGYQDGTIKPNQYVTRAEAAATLEKLIHHIREKITEDYREKIINR